MGNQQTGGSRNSRKSSLTASQQLTNSRIMKNRLVVEQRPNHATTEFSYIMTEAEMLLELAGLYQLTKNEFDSYGLISPFNCVPMSSTMPEAGQQFDRAAKRYLGEARENINRLQNRRRKTLIRDVNVTRELDALIQIRASNEDIRRSLLMEVQSASKSGTLKDRSEHQESDHEIPPPPFQSPASPQAILNQPSSIPRSPALSTQLTPPTASPRPLAGEISLQQYNSSTPITNSAQPKKEPPPLVHEHTSPIEQPRGQVDAPYNLDGFEELSDDDDEKASRESRAVIQTKKMSSIMEHSIEEDEQDIHQSQKARSKEPTPRLKPSPIIADTNSQHTQPHKLRTKEPGNFRPQTAPILSISPRPYEFVQQPSVESPAQNQITSITVKRIQPKQTPKQSPRGSEQKHHYQMVRINTDIQAAEAELYRLLDETINFESILQKYKIAPQMDHHAKQCYRKFVMGPVIDLPSPL